MEDTPGRELRVRSYRASGQPYRVVVEVADSGKGFGAEEAGQLFRPFFTTKKTGHGTGLGLSISRSIIKDHRGTLEAEGEPARGATFTVRLPAYEGTEARDGEGRGAAEGDGRRH